MCLPSVQGRRLLLCLNVRSAWAHHNQRKPCSDKIQSNYLELGLGTFGLFLIVMFRYDYDKFVCYQVVWFKVHDRLELFKSYKNMFLQKKNFTKICFYKNMFLQKYVFTKICFSKIWFYKSMLLHKYVFTKVCFHKNMFLKNIFLQKYGLFYVYAFNWKTCTV